MVDVETVHQIVHLVLLDELADEEQRVGHLLIVITLVETPGEGKERLAVGVELVGQILDQHRVQLQQRHKQGRGIGVRRVQSGKVVRVPLDDRRRQRLGRLHGGVVASAS